MNLYVPIDPEATRLYRALHDGLADMVESGRLTEGDIPDDYQWLVDSLARLAGLDPYTQEEER